MLLPAMSSCCNQPWPYKLTLPPTTSSHAATRHHSPSSASQCLNNNFSNIFHDLLFDTPSARSATLLLYFSSNTDILHDRPAGILEGTTIPPVLPRVPSLYPQCSLPNDPALLGSRVSRHCCRHVEAPAEGPPHRPAKGGPCSLQTVSAVQKVVHKQPHGVVGVDQLLCLFLLDLFSSQ